MPVIVRKPIGPPAPVVFDSPHSGVNYPDDFDHVVPRRRLRWAEDPHVDELFAAAPESGATLIAATFPRTYIDANRAADDLDPGQLDGEWPGAINVSHRARSGVGLIRTASGRDKTPIYGRKLSVAEVHKRIEEYWKPYHNAVRRSLDEAHAATGSVWHVNCHSMSRIWPPVYEKAGEPNTNDYTLGNRDGTTAGVEFTEFVRETLSGFGFNVAVNDGQKGVELVRAYSDPDANRHSLQIEINQRLYLNGKNREKTDGFDEQKQVMTKLIEALCGYARAKTAGMLY
jgi:N-formylglutamate deformylase